MSGKQVGGVARVLLLPLFMAACFACFCVAGCERASQVAESHGAKRTIGATAEIVEKAWGVTLPARVDTGAHTCSIDAEQVEVRDAAEDEKQNVGKQIRFLMRGGDEGSDWIETKITGYATIMTADGREATRYEVRLTLMWHDFEKEVKVTLNDRSKLPYPLLLGRNYLRDDFVVDVSLDSDDKPSDE